MSSLRSGLLVQTALGVVLLAACSSVDQGQGHLLIIGGGLKTANASVHRAFIEAAGAGAKIAVLPTASGVPERSGPGTVEDIERYRLPSQQVDVVAIEKDSFDRAFDPRYVEQLQEARAFWFTGGVQSRILAVFRPDSGDTPAYAAVARRLRQGAIVAGSSAGAAMMSDPMIASGKSLEALLVGVRSVEDRAVALKRGMGFFRHGIVDQHFLRRGRLGRLVVALESTGWRRGYGVAENSALLVNIGSSIGTALGPRAVLVVDVSRMHRQGLSRLDVRLTLLGNQDRIAFRTGEVFPVAGRTSHVATEGSPKERPLEPWGRHTISQLIERLAADPTREQRADGKLFSLVVTADEHTRLHATEGARDSLCVVGARLDIVAAKEAEAAAEQLLAELESNGAER